MKRLFLAVKPDLETLKNLVSLQEEVKSSPALSGLTKLCRQEVKWTAPPNLHLTLHFLGSTTPEKEEALKRFLSTFGPASFSQPLDRLLPFPSWAHAGVLGLATPTAVPALQELWENLGSLLKEQGLPVENRPLVPHVTLVRFQRRVKLPPSETLPQPKTLVFPVRAITLYESVPTKKGSQYEPLADFSLAPPKPA